MKSISNKKKQKDRPTFVKVSDKTVNVHASEVLPTRISINPLYNLLVPKNYALGKRSNDKLSVPLKKGSILIWIIVFVVVMIVAVAAILLLGGGDTGAGGTGQTGGSILPGPLGSIAENFNLPNLSGGHKPS